MGTTNILDLNNRLTKVEKGNVAQNSYTSLKNKPKINSVTLSGNKSLADIGAAAAADMGDKTELDTTDKSSIVAAINELVEKKIGIYNNSGFHNSIYRGESLGTEVTAEQYDAIYAGTFDDMFIGDYWTINGTVYRIAAFDYWLHCGDTETTAHHVVIVPDTSFYNAQMNTSNVTTGGYYGSELKTSGLDRALTTVKADFGAAHVLTHRQLLTNAVANGAASGWAWYDSQIDLMNESMVYGHEAQSSAPGYDTGIDKSQLALFQARPDLIANKENWWLRDVASATGFANVAINGQANGTTTSISFGVRPAFGICK